LCLLRESNEFSSRDVDRLYRSIVAATDRRVRFHCLTDANGFGPGIHVIAIRHPEWEAKYNKLELFRADVQALGSRFFYLDLDTMILGGVDNLFSYDGALAMLDDFYLTPNFGSGVMAWDSKIGSGLYEAFCRMPAEQRARLYPLGRGGGDQLFIQHHCQVEPHRWQTMFPGRVVSYKIHVRSHGNRIPDAASVLCFHGRPRMREVGHLLRNAAVA